MIPIDEKSKYGVVKDRLSLVPYFLKLLAPTGNMMATATGFIYHLNDKYYLITNGHNFTRLDPETNKRIGSSAGFPVIVQTPFRTNIGDGKMGNRLCEITLYSDDDYLKPNWLIHPTHGYRVDVVVLPIKEMLREVDPYPINEIEFAPELDLEVADDVFILGFPFSVHAGKMLPVWKKGSIASEPGILFNDLPCFLIDTATRPGMSGAPVILQRKGKEMIEIDGLPFPHEGTFRNFIGVYSGRLGAMDDPDLSKIQLGVVWRKSVIEEIILGGVIGDTHFQTV